ncbi:MAG TPA: TlpA disulfide reductase family protein [Terriglobales bacterium]|nr:TlpA disulfide reductase family protein [Terriglobales bacterium]
MPALTAGTNAPDITLPDMEGKKFSLQEALKKGPVVVVFFKISCPVCQFALPYLERVHHAVRGKNASVVAVSQNNKRDTAAFLREYGITFPVLLDDPHRYPVSNAYGLTTVPTIFYIAPGGGIEVASVGWSRADLEDIARKLAERVNTSKINVIRAGEEVPDFRGG